MPHRKLIPVVAKTFTAEEVALLVSREVGESVGAAAIHLAVHRSDRRPNARQRATAGLPQPINPGQRPLQFDQVSIHRWLQDHPRRRHAQLIEQLRAELAASEHRRAVAVAQGRKEGLSWAQLAQLIGEVDGVPISRQAIARKYT